MFARYTTPSRISVCLKGIIDQLREALVSPENLTRNPHPVLLAVAAKTSSERETYVGARSVEGQSGVRDPEPEPGVAEQGAAAGGVQAERAGRRAGAHHQPHLPARAPPHLQR